MNWVPPGAAVPAIHHMPTKSHSPAPLRSGPHSLHWQSRLILLLVIPVAGIWLVLALIRGYFMHAAGVLPALLLSSLLALTVFALRAATPAAALTGGLITACLALATPGLHTLVWPLLALFLLTFAATRFGRRRKEALGTAEGRRGRTASQVAANLGAAALATIPFFTQRLSSLSALPIFDTPTHITPPGPSLLALTACVAALAEATADTLSSEFGQVLGGTPRLLTSLRSVPAGTDGAISLAGTLAGAAGAMIVVLIAAVALPLTPRAAAVAFGAAVAGLFFDSLLGATLEPRFLLNNDAVNFLSTLFASLAAALWL